MLESPIQQLNKRLQNPKQHRRFSLLYIGNQLSEHGYTATMVETLGELLAEHYEVFRASSKRLPLLRLVDMLFTLFKLRKRIGIVIIDTYSSKAFYYAWAVALLARLLGKPYIPILHGGDLPRRLQRHPVLCRSIFAFSQVNVAPSEYLCRAFIEAGFQNTELIPNYINISLYPFLLRPSVRPRLLWVRSFHQTYHPEMALKVLALLLPKYPDACLCMVGPDKDGSLERCKLLAAELGIEDKVEFTGLLDKSAWVRLSVQYDIFINTTNFDNTPVSVIEAMALGLPVVSTNAGGLPYLLTHRHDALLTPIGQEKDFATAIEYLINNADFAQVLAQNARQKVASFDWTVLQKRWYKLIEQTSFLS